MDASRSRAESRARGREVASAWMALCFALAIHVTDEARTGFLDVYNPTVTAIRADVPWLPLPVFGFDEWIAGLVIAIIVLFGITRFVYRGAGWTRVAGYAFAAIMTANALGHTLGTLFGRTVATVHFVRPMPGFYSSPFLLAASIYLFWRLRTSASLPLEASRSLR